MKYKTSYSNTEGKKKINHILTCNPAYSNALYVSTCTVHSFKDRKKLSQFGLDITVI